ncbi:MAG TPA: alpha/beta fold hydrolase [Thermoplasmata archaeon]|nr:alpha/beta fold hydrolase [Thermoplasmata archaeon]
MSFVKNGDVDIHYEVEGTGPALVLHTGAGGDLRIWREAGYPAGLPGFQLVLIDQRGRGQSGHPTVVEEHVMSKYVEDVRLVLDAIDVETAGFWGYSNGLFVGLAFGASYPDRLQCMVGTGAVPFSDFTDLPPIEDRSAFIAKVVAEGGVRADVDGYERKEGDRFPKSIDANVRATDPQMGALRRIAWRSWRGPKTVTPKLAVPVLIIAGEKEILDNSTATAIAAFPNARLVTLPGTGHLGAFYRSDLALPHANPFLRENLRRTSRPR